VDRALIKKSNKKNMANSFSGINLGDYLLIKERLIETWGRDKKAVF
jgi:hypothetical protein